MFAATALYLSARTRTSGGALTPEARALLRALDAGAQSPARLTGSTGGTTDPDSRNVVTVTARQAAQLLACSPGFVRRLARSGLLEGHKAGPVWLIDRASLDAYRFGEQTHDDIAGAAPAA
ncbi:helix-turn-helix domain-containing protein [Streptomyces sp. NPDC001584]|uniref:helix-turn-helix domain-containing protein n=1 Tax=Streptomyces sp. NPDC001584 TaxID=3154521 RepID=UPI00331A3A7F